MGVILRVLHRSEKLQKAPFRNLFLDMEENIHIHYRDLRIELSRNEFEDIVNTFSKQSAELMKAIKDTNYQDGVLPNANHEELRIWTDSRLEHDVVYHPHRISVEECTDGYHVHLRNYKLLLSAEDFGVLVDAFKQMDMDAPLAASMDEVIELLDANHVFYNRRPTNDGAHQLTVAHYHEPKVRAVLSGIGMKRQSRGPRQTYTKDDLKIVVELSRDREDFKEQMKGAPRTVVPLIEALVRKKDNMNADWLNAIKAQVLDTITLLSNPDVPVTVSLGFETWLYDTLYEKVIFPFEAAPKKTDPQLAYRAWSQFLKTQDMYFVKPSKVPYQPAKQKDLQRKIKARINDIAAAVPAISKIWVMGSARTRTMGFYKSPFIHSQWAKLASDVDLLIEIDADKTFTPPEDWTYINVSSTNGCEIYHLGEIPFSDVFRHRKTYPHLAYFDHLLDAYVYRPPTGDADAKDAFLEKFKAELLFDRADEDALRATVAEQFGAPVDSLHKLDVATENDLYEISLADQTDILKVYRVSGNFNSTALAEHTTYEGALVCALAERGATVANVRETLGGAAMFEINSAPAILFEKIDGQELSPPDARPADGGTALARLHQVQLDAALGIKTAFSFDDTVKIWHTEFNRFAGESTVDDGLTQAFEQLRPTFASLLTTYEDLGAHADVLQLHNHGDVQPRNMIAHDDQLWMIDFQNAFFGPRLLDLVEGGIEFSWGVKNPDHTDFANYDTFVSSYTATAPLRPSEEDRIIDALKVVGTIKFVKEVRMIKGDRNENNLRRRRALDLAAFMFDRI